MGRCFPALVLVAALAGVAACRTAAPPGPPSRVPDPLSPPPSARPLAKPEIQAIYRALAAAERGDGAAARRAMGHAPADHPAVALAVLEMRFLLGERVGDEADRLAQSQGEYRQAYSFAAQALQSEGRFPDALAAARRAMQLGGGEDEARRARQLEALVVGGALERARAALAGGDGERAVALAHEALNHVPGALSLIEILVRGYLLVGDVQAAARLVTALPEDGDGLELKGRVAAAGGQWELAASLFNRLPHDHPGRCGLLQDARRRGRLGQAPPYVQRALGSTNLTRAELAALVVWEVPSVQEHARGAVPVFEDIVNLAERRDVVAVVRAGVMGGDSVTRRFSPHRRVRSRELVQVVERLVEVLGRRPVPWCGENRHDSCLQVPGEVVTGAAASALVRRVAPEGEETCQ